MGVAVGGLVGDTVAAGASHPLSVGEDARKDGRHRKAEGGRRRPREAGKSKEQGEERGGGGAAGEHCAGGEARGGGDGEQPTHWEAHGMQGREGWEEGEWEV